MPPQRAAHKRGLPNLVSPLLVRHTTTLPPAPTGRRHPAPTTRALPARTGQAADAAPAKSPAIIISHNDDDTATTTTTTTTLLVDGLPFTTPTDPLEAFHATRSQTIASFRGVSAGAPGARDMGFIFGPALAPTAAQSTVAGGLSISQQPPAAAASRRTGDTRDFCIDKHIFTVPAEPVPAFLATRDMTMAAFRRVMEGAAGVRDMALVSGTATISASGEEAVLVDKVDRGGGRAPARPRGRKGDMPPPRVHKPLHISHDDDDNDDDTEGQDEAPNPPTPPAHAAATIRVRPKKTLQPPAAGAAAPTPAAAAPGGALYRPKGFYANDLPLGDFTDIAHAKRVLGRSDAWCKGKYIDGMLTLGGERARSRLVTAGGGCTHCAVVLDKEGVAAVCRVLVGDEDRWVRMRKRKCGSC
ncbi:hypothetical protein DFP73DRAFT_587386 [Morchella snyderi]|nr:hypothetical protein DFP73DRAFT_587386 [Morchella snyderi]